MFRYILQIKNFVRKTVLEKCHFNFSPKYVHVIVRDLHEKVKNSPFMEKFIRINVLEKLHFIFSKFVRVLIEFKYVGKSPAKKNL